MTHQVRRQGLRVLAAGAMVWSAMAGEVHAIMFTGTPEDSWAYRKEDNPGKGSNINYFPVQTSEYATTVFQGYVTYDDPAFGIWGPQYVGGSTSFQIFTTHVLADHDVTIPLVLGGDDGHALFINDQFVTGAGFGVAATHSLALQANTPVKVEVAGYDAIGPSWIFSLNTGGAEHLPIEGIDGVSSNAEGFPSTPIPEPTGLSLLGLGLIGLTGARRRTNKSRVSV